MKIRYALGSLIAIFVMNASARVWLTADEPTSDPARSSTAAASDRDAGAPPVAEIDVLIQQLGHPNYPERVRARAELAQMGLMAFDALHAAQNSLDHEVAMAARHLISSLQVSWSSESDAAPVKEILKDYGSQNEVERRTRIERLGQLEDRTGLQALLRLVRYETSLRLSRDAALEIMRHPVKGQTASDRQDAPSAEQIINALGSNQRAAAQWLRLYANDLKSGLYAIQPWREAIALERETVEGLQSEHTDATAALELVRVCAVRAAWAGQRDEAERLAESSLDLIRPGRRQLIEAVTWALESELSPMVLELRRREPERFASEPLLQYAAAEAYARLGDDEQAKQLSQAAGRIEPLPPRDSPAAKAMSANEKENIAYRHREVGRILESRGRFEWAIQEYQHIVDALAVDVEVAATTRKQLARLQGDLQQHQAVVDLLEPLAQRLRSDNGFERRMQEFDLVASKIYEDLEIHRGLAAAAAGEFEKAQESLQTAFTLSGRFNADTLIAMYRTPGDEAWQNRVLQEIKVLSSLFEEQIHNVERNRSRGGRTISDEQLAAALNQYAWLVSNTVGDYRKSLRYSVRSLQLSPDNPMLLDTCARCYFALGELDKAVLTQRRATELMPHQPPMERQLAEFIAAREKAKTGTPTDSAGDESSDE